MTSHVTSSSKRSEDNQNSELEQCTIFVYAPTLALAKRWRKAAELQGLSVSEFIVDRVLKSFSATQTGGAVDDEQEESQRISALEKELRTREQEYSEKLLSIQKAFEKMIETKETELRDLQERKDLEINEVKLKETNSIQQIISEKDTQISTLQKERDYYKRLYEIVNDQLSLSRLEEI